MRNIKKPIALALVLLNGFSQLTPLAYAQNTNANLRIPIDPVSSIYLQPRQNSDPSKPLLSLDDTSSFISSAHQRQPVSVEALEKADYKATEDVTLTITNPDDEPLKTKVTDAEGKEVQVEVEQTDTALGTEVSLPASNQLKPGKYTIAITDSQGKTVTQDFSWGVLALNTDKSIYHPGETAKISIGVLDDKGEMVCDADVALTIIHQESGRSDMVSTENGKILVNAECSSYTFTLKPDFETSYKLQDNGVYALQLTAKTPNGTHAIEDTITVKDQIPFDVKRTSATRIYPPLKYPMQYEITANQDFEGTVTETVPAGFIITPGEDENSYEIMNTLYMNESTSPQNSLKQNVLGAQTSRLGMPFDGNFAISQGFGSELTDSSLKKFYSHYGLGGHDGVDFALPERTPLYAVDDGNILVAGKGDYGITVIIQHSWGRSYYGHLSETIVEAQSNIKKGTLIGYSGNTGESTGPHLHFGIKPEQPDMENGYLGKIDPLPYLPHAGNLLAESLPILSSGQDVLAASTSADQAQSESAESTDNANVPATLASSLPSFTLSDKEIKREVKSDQPATVEKVKVISWNVKLKKGETTKLSYTYQTPQVSPQFYLLGPLTFFENGQEIFSEQRQWQLAADAIGVGWYNNSWLYRKQITIDRTKVPSTQTNFPVLISLSSDTARAAKTQSSGNDIIFTDSTGKTKLSHEIESYSSGTGVLVAWVKILSLSSSSDTNIYMYYGNPAASNGQNVADVWSNNFAHVWHLSQTPPTAMTDSVGVANASIVGSPTQTAGQIDGSLDLTSNEYASAGDINTVDSKTTLTVSAWMKRRAANAEIYIGKEECECSPTFTADNNILLQMYADGLMYFSLTNQADPGNIGYAYGTVASNDTNWHYATMAYDGSLSGNANRLKGYLDGTARTLTFANTIPATTANSTHSFDIGAVTTWPEYTNGFIDEVRISSVTRSADWIATEYNNQNSPSTFYSVGSEETVIYAPNNNELMRHGAFFDSSGSEQPFVF